MNTSSQPFTILDVPTDAFCDPDTGVCAVSLPAVHVPSEDGNSGGDDALTDENSVERGKEIENR